MPVTNAVLTFAAAVTLLTFNLCQLLSWSRSCPTDSKFFERQHMGDFSRRLASGFQGDGPHQGALHNDHEAADTGRGPLCCGVDRALIDCDRPDSRPRAAGRRSEKVFWCGAETVRNPRSTGGDRLFGGSIPGPRRARYRVLRVEETRAGAEPAQGVHLHQQRVRRRHVERLRGSDRS